MNKWYQSGLALVFRSFDLRVDLGPIGKPPPPLPLPLIVRGIGLRKTKKLMRS